LEESNDLYVKLIVNFSNVSKLTPNIVYIVYDPTLEAFGQFNFLSGSSAIFEVIQVF
jgi:hypothetical protein